MLNLNRAGLAIQAAAEAGISMRKLDMMLVRYVFTLMTLATRSRFQCTLRNPVVSHLRLPPSLLSWPLRKMYGRWAANGTLDLLFRVKLASQLPCLCVLPL